MENNAKPRLNMIRYPTPFHELANLRVKIGAQPRLFIKRDDLTEIGLGGNKNRKLDYVMKEAVDSGADTIITWAGVQSNHCRQTLAYAVTLGMECHLILNGEDNKAHQGNLFVYDMFGAKLHFQPDGSKCPAECDALAEELSRQGKKPYVVPIGASTPLGSLGYIDSVREISLQAGDAGIKVSHLFVASGSAGTQAGVEVGARLYLPGCRVHGVAVSRGKDMQAEMVAKIANETAALMGADTLCFSPCEITVHDEYYGGVYGVPTQGGNEAIRLMGRTEAILLDPVYTGKAMCAMLDILKSGKLNGEGAVVFIHTGGSPAIYSFTDSFR